MDRDRFDKQTDSNLTIGRLTVGGCVCLDEVMHVAALARINRLFLVYPLSSLFDYYESRVHRNIIYARLIIDILNA